VADELEQFPKSVKRFSDKNCGKNKRLEQNRDSKIVHFALGTGKSTLERWWRVSREGNLLSGPHEDVELELALQSKFRCARLRIKWEAPNVQGTHSVESRTLLTSRPRQSFDMVTISPSLWVNP